MLLSIIKSVTGGALCGLATYLILASSIDDRRYVVSDLQQRIKALEDENIKLKYDLFGSLSENERLSKQCQIISDR